MFGKQKHISTLKISEFEIEIQRKKVKNLNIRIYPAQDKIKMSVPRRTPDSVIRKFVLSKIPWIRKHMQAYRARPEVRALKYVSGEMHAVWGEKLPLYCISREKAPVVENTGDELVLWHRSGASTRKRKEILQEWYREELKKEIPLLIEKWEKPMKVWVSEFGVKRMKTRWGTCNIRDQRIWLNLHLAKYPPGCLEYVVVHEMVHLLERLHTKRFYALMDQFMPDWQKWEKLLKSDTIRMG